MSERIWDNKPDDGGGPVQVVVGNPTEAVARDPTRYSRNAPDGTAHGEIERRATEAAAEKERIRGEEIKRLNEIAKDKQDKIDAIAAEELKAAEERREAQRAEAAAAAEKATADEGIPPSRRAEIDRLEADAHAEAERVRLETADKLAALDAAPTIPTSPPVEPAPPTEPEGEAATGKRKKG